MQHSRPKRMKFPFGVRGFTIIETLVALIVLSVGMIGTAALYSQGLGAARTARYRVQAVNLVADLSDRIRVNRLGQAAYAGGAANNNCDPVGGATCLPAQMAAHDLFVWDQQVRQVLPNGQWQVQFNAAVAPPSYTIQVSWDEVGIGRINHQMQIQVPTI